MSSEPQLSTEFDRDTSVSEVSRTEDEAVFAADLAPGWQVGGGLNGGYLLATIGRALQQTVPKHPHPYSISAYYVGPGVAGEATISTRVVRLGGSSVTLAAELAQQGQRKITALATYGDHDTMPSEVRTTAQPPEMAPLEQCFPTSAAPEELRRIAPLMERMDLRLDPAYAGWAVGAPSGEGIIQGWFRLPEGRESDVLSLLLAVDALPPVTFDLGRPGWAPTVELTAHVRGLPAPGWLRVRHATRNVAGGMFEEDCEVWDSTDRLVAQARQLARLPRG
ncbi:thioesterase family protein [Nocardioides daejeonensis]|uniref:thioesterase family protein n=1 Tax=Nocardioides daejeonensis TaxID=1046556 RepID=UPI000D74A104|nr:thioesterase family protein [Nocardioides daejeonensis]